MIFYYLNVQFQGQRVKIDAHMIKHDMAYQVQLKQSRFHNKP